jgi:anti-sigma regulatory factor (Ser/Thr protein kinase)
MRFMADLLTRCFDAHFATLPSLLDAARGACREANLTADAIHRVELVLEEAFSNSVRHGYGGETNLPVWLTTRILPDGIELVYQDSAPPFDPLHDARLPRIGTIGGVGRVLMNKLPRNARYTLVDGRNTLTFEFDRTA